MPGDRITSFQWPRGEVSVELEAWGGEDLSAGELVWPTQEEPSSAGGGGHGGSEAGAEDKGPGADDSVVEEAGTQLGFEELLLKPGGASGVFPWRLLCMFLLPALHLQ